MLNLFPDTPELEMRSFIGKFQIQGDEGEQYHFLKISALNSDHSLYNMFYSYQTYDVLDSQLLPSKSLMLL